MDWADYLRDEAVKFRQLAETAEDPSILLLRLRLVVSVDMTRAPRTWRPKRPCLNTFARQETLIAPGPRPHGEDIPIYNGPRCTLLELSEGKFRWPLSNPRAAGFCLWE